MVQGALSIDGDGGNSHFGSFSTHPKHTALCIEGTLMKTTQRTLLIERGWAPCPSLLLLTAASLRSSKSIVTRICYKIPKYFVVV